MGPTEGKHQPRVLLAATTWWHSSARLAMALIRQGCTVSAVCPPGHPLRLLSGVHRLYKYRGLDSLGALKSAILDSRPDVVVPCNDGVVWQLHSLHACYPELRSLIETSLGAPAMYPTIRSRRLLLETAAALGIPTPPTETLLSEENLEKWRRETTVLKVDGSWGGKGVAIARSAGEALDAFREFTREKGAGFAVKRLLINRDPLALWLRQNGKLPRVSIQRFIAGCPANTMFVAWNGEVLASVTVEVISSQGATGAATVVRLIRNAQISQAVRLLARKLMLSGFHGLDFILEEGTGTPYLIELNPRFTQLGHLRIPGQGDLAGAFTAALKGTAPPAAYDCIAQDTIAFLQQESFFDAKNPNLARSYRDVPWEEPALLRELLLEPWPNRRLMARAWHFFRPPNQPREVRYEPALAASPDQDFAEGIAVADNG